MCICTSIIISYIYEVGHSIMTLVTWICLKIPSANISSDISVYERVWYISNTHRNGRFTLCWRVSAGPSDNTKRYLLSTKTAQCQWRCTQPLSSRRKSLKEGHHGTYGAIVGQAVHHSISLGNSYFNNSK